MTLLVIQLAALGVGLVAELIGVARHERGEVDTYSEMMWWLRDNTGPVGLAALLAVTGLMIWAVPHLWGVI